MLGKHASGSGNKGAKQNVGRPSWNNKNDWTMKNDQSETEASKNKCFTAVSINYAKTPDLRITLASIPQW